MVHRVIGQEQLPLVTKPSARSSLDEMAALLDWAPVADLLKPIYAGEKGEAAWPPPAMFKAPLLAVWYDLSGAPPATASIALISRQACIREIPSAFASRSDPCPHDAGSGRLHDQCGAFRPCGRLSLSPWRCPPAGVHAGGWSQTPQTPRACRERLFRQPCRCPDST